MRANIIAICDGVVERRILPPHHNFFRTHSCFVDQRGMDIRDVKGVGATEGFEFVVAEAHSRDGFERITLLDKNGYSLRPELIDRFLGLLRDARKIILLFKLGTSLVD